MEPTDLSVEKIVEMAVMAGRMAAERAPADAYKATERRLYALPILREKQKWDRERLPKLEGAARADLEAAMAVDAYEIETLEWALVNCAGAPYYQTVTGRYFESLDDEQIGKLSHCDVSTVWRNRKRLIQCISVYLYGAFAVR